MPSSFRNNLSLPINFCIICRICSRNEWSLIFLSCITFISLIARTLSRVITLIACIICLITAVILILRWVWRCWRVCSIDRRWGVCSVTRTLRICSVSRWWRICNICLSNLRILRNWHVYTIIVIELTSIVQILYKFWSYYYLSSRINSSIKRTCWLIIYQKIISGWYIKCCSKKYTINISVRISGILNLKVLILTMKLYNKK